jgi:peptide/nickel transport system substrate-binding protein
VEKQPGYWRKGFTLAIAATMALAACTQAPSASPTPGAAARGAGGDLRILYWQAPTILNGHQGTGTKDSDASRLVLQPLASWDKDGKAIPNALAAEIPTVENGGVSRDFKTVTWKLRPNMKWSDGTAFSADDVVFTHSYQCNEATNASTFGVCEGLKSVTAKDPNTVVVEWTNSNPFYFQWGVGFNTLILQKAQYSSCIGAAAANCPADQKPIGMGPYKVREFKAGDVVTYDMNENYFDPKKPYFKSVTFKGGGDAPSAARAVFQTGDVDYAWNLQVEATILRPMSQQSTVGTLITSYSASVERLLVNRADPSPALGDRRAEPDTKHPFFSDIAVRRALAMATNRAAVAGELYGDGLAGRATCNIITGPEPMASKNTATLDVCKYDLAAANAELEKAGWIKGSDGVRAKGGVKLNILYQTTVNAVRQKTQDILKKDWESVGFKVELRSEPSTTFFTNTSPGGANHFWADVEMFTNSGDPDPTSILNGWTCGQRASKANNWNFSGYERFCDPQYDAIVDQLRRETDQAKRNQLVMQANDYLIKDVVIIPLVDRTAVTSGIAKSLKGVVASGWDSEMYNIADWSK